VSVLIDATIINWPLRGKPHTAWNSVMAPDIGQAEIYLMDKQGHFVEAFNLKRKPKVSAAELRKYM
jgi:hypothetical protein